MAFLTSLTLDILIPTFLPLILVVIAGVLMGRLIEKLDDRTLSALLLYIFTPCLVLYSILTAENEAGTEMTQIAFFWFFHSAIMLAVSHQLLKILKYSVHQRRLIVLTVVVLNAANYPIPLNEFQYGEAGRETAVRIMLILQIIYVTVGVYLASDKASWIDGIEEIFRLPLAYAAILGFTLYFFGLRLPAMYQMTAQDVISATGEDVGTAANVPGPLLMMSAKLLNFLQAPAIPLNLLMLGVIIGKGFYLLDFDSYKRMLPAVILSAILRLIASPILGFMLIFVMKIENPQLAKSLLIHSAMPTAVYVAIFVAFYGQPSDKRFAALSIIFSTIVSFITVPLLIAWIENSTLAIFGNVTAP